MQGKNVRRCTENGNMTFMLFFSPPFEKMGILPEVPLESQQKGNEKIASVKEAIKRANANAIAGIVEQVPANAEQKKNEKGYTRSINYIGMNCGVDTCTNIDSVIDRCKNKFTKSQCPAPCEWEETTPKRCQTMMDGKCIDGSGDMGGGNVIVTGKIANCKSNPIRDGRMGCWGACTNPAASTDHLCLAFSLPVDSSCPDGTTSIDQYNHPDGFTSGNVQGACQSWYRDTQVGDATASMALLDCKNTSSCAEQMKREEGALSKAATAACGGSQVCVSTASGYHKTCNPIFKKDGTLNWCQDLEPIRGVRWSQTPRVPGSEKASCNTIPCEDGASLSTSTNTVLSDGTAKCSITNVDMRNEIKQIADQVKENHQLLATDLRRIRDAMRDVASMAVDGIDWEYRPQAQDLSRAVVNASHGIQKQLAQDCTKNQTDFENIIYQKCSPAWKSSNASGCSIDNITQNNSRESFKTCLQQVQVDTSALDTVGQQLTQLSEATSSMALPDLTVLGKKLSIPRTNQILVIWIVVCAVLGAINGLVRKSLRAGVVGTVGGLVVAALGVGIFGAITYNSAEPGHLRYKTYGGVPNALDVIKTQCKWNDVAVVENTTADAAKDLCKRQKCKAWAFVPNQTPTDNVPLTCNPDLCLKDPTLCTQRGVRFGTCCPKEAAPIVDNATDTSPARIWCASCRDAPSGTGYIFSSTNPSNTCEATVQHVLFHGAGHIVPLARAADMQCSFFDLHI